MPFLWFAIYFHCTVPKFHSLFVINIKGHHSIAILYFQVAIRICGNFIPMILNKKSTYVELQLTIFTKKKLILYLLDCYWYLGFQFEQNSQKLKPYKKQLHNLVPKIEHTYHQINQNCNRHRLCALLHIDAYLEKEIRLIMCLFTPDTTTT